MNSNLKEYFSVVIIISIAVLISIAGANGGKNYGSMPILFICMIISFLIHWLVFIPSFLAKTERYFDITGTVTYLSLLGLAFCLTIQTTGSVLESQSILLIFLVAFWSLRLGTFLFVRILKDGEDKRFRDIKVSFSKFLLGWTLSALWVFLASANALTAIINNVPFKGDLFTYVGTALWVLGFLFEVISDEQKRKFRADPANSDSFISHGLWSYSRHPNYFGEIVLWLGIAFISFPTLVGWQFVTLISPVFVLLILTRVSGVNLLERKADETWGEFPAYKIYKKKTPVLVPFIHT